MIMRDICATCRVGILAEHSSRAADAIVAHLRLAAAEMSIDAAAHELGDRNPKLPGPSFHLPVLIFIELYLNTHHDGISIPS